ncbi:MAG: hypothetical protein HOE90_21880 [Bacteriovoracaceae bacterium]|jgi:hypothetical protein|nr:hypothetical protein [Bacteriovoracaceae bacterium]
MISRLLLLLLALLCTGPNAWADKEEGLFNKLLAPGPLSLPHHDLEAMDCLKCHSAGEGVPNEKCLACHKEIKEHVKLKKSFHGNNVKGRCLKCHTEHLGRKNDTTKVKQRTFEHKLTGHILKGKHKKTKCIECHTTKRTKKAFRKNEPHYLGTTTSCKGCHKKDDSHKFKGKWEKLECSKCHGEKKWKEDNHDFTHNKDTKHKILGAHKKLKCIKCHLPKGKKEDSIYKFEGLKEKQCLTCHQSRHKENFGPKFVKKSCNTCHNQKSFKMEKFDHSITGFKLTDKHAKLDCIKCHKQSDKKMEIKSEHFVWKGTKADCRSCHKPTHHQKFTKKFEKLKCTTCHTTKSYKDEAHAKANFDHGTTKFKLTGKHKKNSCRKCHLVNKKSTYEFKNEKSGYCLSCHKTPHTEQFRDDFSEQSCNSCHRTESFKDVHRKEFDHNETEFELLGKHQKVKCQKCHVPTNKTFKESHSFKGKFIFDELGEKSCLTCHKDHHKSEMGPNCRTCHTERGWKVQRDFHKDMPLTGVHYTLSCTECHFEERKLKGLGDQCIVCHTKDDIHLGSLPKCGACHHQEVWEVTRFKHSMTRFPLRGVHRTLDCNSCHGSGNYQGTQSSCISCHTSDALSVANPVHIMPQFNDCSRCHNQFSF